MKTSVFYAILIICALVIAASASIASEIIINNADTIWRSSPKAPPDRQVETRILVEYANTIYHNTLGEPVFEPPLSSRVVILTAQSYFSRTLIYPPFLTIVNFTAKASNTNVDLTWVNQRASELPQTMIVYSRDIIMWKPTYRTSYKVGDEVDDGVTVCYIGAEDHSTKPFTLQKLAPRTTYYFAAFACDNLRNYSYGSYTSVTTGELAGDNCLTRITLTLHKGINLISVPVKTETSWRLSDLARYIGKSDVTMIISYDYAEKKFISYLPETTPESAKSNVPVRCGEGYIVLMKTEKEVTFEGYNCTDEVAAAPSPISSILFNEPQRISIFAVTGYVINEETDEPLDDVTVKVRNLRTGRMFQDKTGVWAGSGGYVITIIVSEEGLTTRPGDKLEITAQDANYRLTMEPVIHTLTLSEVANSAIVMPLRLSLPMKTALLPNYPNPFNPETWIPFELAKESDVTIRIYDVNGRLIRTLDLGNLAVGLYRPKQRAAYWNGRTETGEQVASGVYFYTIHAGKFQATKKMVIVR